MAAHGRIEQGRSGNRGEDRPDPARRAVAYIVGRCDLTLWELSPAERLRRNLARAGVDTILDDGDDLPATGGVILVRADFVFDDRIVDALVQTPGIVLEAEGPKGAEAVAAHVEAGHAGEVAANLRQGSPAKAPAGVRVVPAQDIGSAYRKALRTRDKPYVIPLLGVARSEIEWRMFKGSYKGVTDLVTKWVWPVPAFWATKLAARWRLTPNLVTAASLVLAIGAIFLFMIGYFAPGLVAAWLMTFLDTVDGKLARVTLKSSRLGNVFDHGIDLVHPPFWYAAWGVGLATDGPISGHLTVILAVVVGGYLVGRVVEGLFIWIFKMEIHVWRPIDSSFRLVTARRNPNLVMLTASTIAGRPDIGLLAVAVWTALSLAFHSARFLTAASVRRRDGRLDSWLAEAARP